MTPAGADQTPHRVWRAIAAATAAGRPTSEHEVDVARWYRHRRQPADPAMAQPDGERILTWRQLAILDARPDHLIVVGLWVTVLEFVDADRIGVPVTVVAS